MKKRTMSVFNNLGFLTSYDSLCIFRIKVHIKVQENQVVQYLRAWIILKILEYSRMYHLARIHFTADD